MKAPNLEANMQMATPYDDQNFVFFLNNCK